MIEVQLGELYQTGERTMGQRVRDRDEPLFGSNGTEAQPPGINLDPINPTAPGLVLDQSRRIVLGALPHVPNVGDRALSQTP
jgi:hypothetical protein